MWSCFFSFGLLVLMISNCFCLTSSKPHLNLTTDESALIAFKKSILVSKSTSNFLKNWSLNTPICGWIGVSCGNKHRRVTALNVSGYGLEGIIPPNLGNLTFLRFLDTSSNNFTGALPSELSKLRRLEYINIGANNFTGEIPSWFGALSQLQHIYLNENRFSGTIPSSLFNISRLRRLDMSFNILDGKIPPEIGTSSSLERVSLEGNRLNGSIPDSIFRISSLITINLGDNKLSGKLPNNICSNSPGLKEFTVYWNEIYGEIPRNISKCRELVFLQLQVNNFSGNIPSEIGGMSKLEALYLWSNQFNGSIPNQIGNLTSLEVLVLQSNKLTGSIPNQIGNLTSLQVLNLGVNMFTGGMPEQIWNLTSLTKLWLASNYFTDSIPKQVGNLISLEQLNLASNNLTGSIPKQIGNLASLEELVLGFNKLTDMTLSSAFNKLTHNTFNGLNFMEWKGNLFEVLFEENIIYVLNTPKPSLSIMSSWDEIRAQREWTTADNRARFLIMTSVNDTYQDSLDHLEHSADIMRDLNRMHRYEELIERNKILSKILSSELVEGGSVHEHVCGMIRLFDKHSMHGGKIDEESKTEIVYRSLTKEYDAFVLGSIAAEEEWTLVSLAKALDEFQKEHLMVKAQKTTIDDRSSCQGCSREIERVVRRAERREKRIRHLSVEPKVEVKKERGFSADEDDE